MSNTPQDPLVSAVIGPNGSVTAVTQSGQIHHSADGTTWNATTLAQAEARNLEMAKAAEEPEAIERMRADQLKNLPDNALTFKDVCDFVGMYRDQIDPQCPILLPGWNDYGLVAMEKSGLIPVVVRSDPDNDSDGETARALKLVAGDPTVVEPSEANAIVFHHGANFPGENEKY